MRFFLIALLNASVFCPYISGGPFLDRSASLTEFGACLELSGDTKLPLPCYSNDSG